MREKMIALFRKHSPHSLVAVDQIVAKAAKEARPATTPLGVLVCAGFRS